MPIFHMESESKGKAPIEDLKKYNDLVLNTVERFVNAPSSPLICTMPGKKQAIFSGIGLLVDIGVKHIHTTIPVKFWIRHAYSQLRDYPRLHLPAHISNCKELYAECQKQDLHFCVIILNNGSIASFWADRYDSILFEEYIISSRWESNKKDRLCTPWTVQKGKLHAIGRNYCDLFDRFLALIEQQIKKEREHLING